MLLGSREDFKIIFRLISAVCEALGWPGRPQFSLICGFGRSLLMSLELVERTVKAVTERLWMLATLLFCSGAQC